MPKHNRLNAANKKLAGLIRALNKDGYPYTGLLMGELNVRKFKAKFSGASQAEAIQWAIGEAEGYLAARIAFRAKLEAAKRLDAVVEEYDEAMMVQETFDKVAGE